MPRRSTSELYQRYLNLSAVAGVESITVDQDRGAELWDVDGTKYLDCFAGKRRRSPERWGTSPNAVYRRLWERRRGERDMHPHRLEAIDESAFLLTIGGVTAHTDAAS
jgi:hypothetical protein